MKLKIVIIALCLIGAIISGAKIGNFNTSNDVENSNTVAIDENVITRENIVQTENINQENINNNKELENKKIENKSKTNESYQQSTSIAKKETTQKTQETTPKKEESKTGVVETQKDETQATKTLTQSDLEYWCVAGGEHHIAGDRENEHGYYLSWDEAYNAFENYTKDWNSVQFKISQCSCGLFYFWAIQ